MAATRNVSDCRFMGSSRRDLTKFPESVKDAVGHALFEAQCGLEPLKAKALKGFAGRGVLELVEDHDGNTYRAVYTVRFAEMVLRPPLLSKKVEDRNRDAAERYRFDKASSQSRRGRLRCERRGETP